MAFIPPFGGIPAFLRIVLSLNASTPSHMGVSVRSTGMREALSPLSAFWALEDMMTVKTCPSCGTTNSLDAMQCMRCGTMLPQIQQPMQYQQQPQYAPQYQSQYPPQQPPQKEGSHNAWVIGVAVAVVAIVILVIILASSGGVLGGSSATLHINVNSTHLLFSVSYNLYVNGALIDSDTLAAGYYMAITYTYHWASQSSTTITVSATSTGGGFGSQTDSESVLVSNGGSFTVNLYI